MADLFCRNPGRFTWRLEEGIFAGAGQDHHGEEGHAEDRHPKVLAVLGSHLNYEVHQMPPDITNKEMENKDLSSIAELDGVSVRDAQGGHQLVSVLDLLPLKCGCDSFEEKNQHQAKVTWKVSFWFIGRTLDAFCTTYRRS